MSHSFISDTNRPGLLKLSPSDGGAAVAAIEASDNFLYDRAADLVIGKPKYLGQVATGCKFPQSIVNYGLQVNTRTGHYARDNITSLQVAWANFYGYSEAAPGAATTYEASIEYPVGTFTRITFGGGNIQTIPDGSMGGLSDPVSINIPIGSLFYIRSFAQNSAGGVPFAFLCASSFVLCELAASGLSSKVMAGSFSAATQGFGAMPAIILGQTRKPSVFTIGDSISDGMGDVIDDLTGEAGILHRSIGPHFGYSTFTQGGYGLGGFVGSSVKRRAVINAYFTHVVNQLGFNDLGTSNTAVSVLATMVNFIGLPGIASKPVFQTTITPSASSTDNFATVANQTAINATERAALNKQIVAGMPGFAGFFDVGREAEATMYSGKFRVDYGLPTADNVHPSNLIYREMRRTKAIDPCLIVR